MGDFEKAVRAAGLELHARAGGRRPELFRGLTGQLMARTMADDALRDGLFQLVDALPQLRDSADIASHLSAYLAKARGHGWESWLLDFAARPTLAWTVRLFVRRLARQFLAEESEASVLAVLDRIAGMPATATLDAVGEAVLSEAEADAYLARNLRLLAWMARRDRGDALAEARPHLSLKLTALTSRFDPVDPRGSRERVFARIEPLIAAAARHQATLTVDMEQRELKPLILDLFLALAEAFPGPWTPAIALQAYLPETTGDAARVFAHATRLGRPLGVRLVKGAYWDQEAAWAAQRGWPVPTYRSKSATDVHFEQLTAWLLERAELLRPAIASHNIRSQAVALAHARRLNLPAAHWEAQMLYGMAEPLAGALTAEGVPLRLYVPTGDLGSGIAYLIRRLLENTAGTSVLRQAFERNGDGRSLLVAPLREPEPAAPAPAGLVNLPLLDFSESGRREAFVRAIVELRASLPRRHALALPEAGGPAAGRHRVGNPADAADLLGEVELADTAHARAAVSRALAAFPAWHDRGVAARVGLLRRAADRIAAERLHLAALEVLEEAKPWREADADVAEAVDFLRYYADGMERLAGWQPTVEFPGESNAFGYAPRGVAVVIAPWNFPLAILAGMSAAALVAGNTVILKPALPATLVAYEYRRILIEAGLPPDAVQLLPGEAEVGRALVGHANVAVIAFTGSRQVGLQILQAAHTPAPGSRQIKQVICEMGGKNAIIVDADADLDEAVAGIIGSAFGYSGQKCSAASRVIAVAPVHDRLLARLCDAAASLAWGPPEDPAFDHGPLITAAAQAKALHYLAIGKAEGRLTWQGRVPEDRGWYAPPAIIAGIEPQHRLAREEVFGPVLAVMKAPSFAAALEMAGDSDYALTGGVYSRLPAHLALARDHFRVGNLYLNRKITGARVGIQPFGGVGLSGTGIQAGGPDYLKQFLWSRSVCANTMRHGFLPMNESP